ncbi:AAA family ATPase [Granulicella sp. S190]|uniref:AAA family ATPase n=1 Tax=Granulicella sp. S190 TaxID=1747226 RepID=UPI00131BCE4E|nr:AAA family ATPase [Granulicella sp. S190]
MPDIECLADIQTTEIEYLSALRLPLGMLVGIEGNPGEGKTWVQLYIAAALSNGRDPFTKAPCKPVASIIVSCENHPNVLVARLTAMGANMKRIHLLNGVINKDKSKRSLTLSDTTTIRAAIIGTNARYIVFDPLQSYMGANVDSHKANETRPLLDALAKLAAEMNVCIVIVRHLAKSNTGRNIHAGLGSTDISGAMRIILRVGTASDDPLNRAIFHTKSNIGVCAEPLGFVIEGKDDAARLVWKGKSSLTLADLNAPESSKRRTQVDDAEDYLREALADGPKFINDLVKNSGFNKNALDRASVRGGIKKTRKGESGPWLWELNPPSKFSRRAGE